MLAIVLTCDRYRPFTEHMIHCYKCLWPHHPFRFRVPYQALQGGPNSFDSQYVSTPPSIKETVLTLLEDLDDEQWIYWCIDDKYPIALNLARIEPIMQWLLSESSAEDISGLLFCRCRDLLYDENLTGRRIMAKNGTVLLERRTYHQIWIHQFLRVKVLRHLFHSFPPEIPSAKNMDALLLGVERPTSHRMFVAERNLAIFGESTARGEITRNCYESIVNKRLSLHDWVLKDHSEEIIIGNFDVPNERIGMTRRALKVQARAVRKIERKVVLEALKGRMARAGAAWRSTAVSVASLGHSDSSAVTRACAQGLLRLRAWQLGLVSWLRADRNIERALDE